MLKWVTEEEKGFIERELERDKSKLMELSSIIMTHLAHYAMGEGRKHVRLIAERPQKIKSLGAIVDKINTRRSNGETCDYSYIDDLVGAKILCPYDSDIEAVCQWLARQRRFKVQPFWREAQKEMDKKYQERGYRGLHFRLTAPSISKSLKFELQIKTLLAEAWDVWTHDIRYHRKTKLSEELDRHVTLLGQMLFLVDQQSELLKNQTIAEEKEAEQRRWAAAQTHLQENIKRDPNTFDTMSFPKQIENFDKTIDTPRVIENLAKLEKEKGLNDTICRGYALLALLDETEEHEKTALRKADELRQTYLSDPSSYITQGIVYWSLGYFPEAVIYAEQGIKELEELAEKTGSLPKEQLDVLNVLKAQFIYFVSECKDISRENKAREYLNILEETPGDEDTKGYFLITFGTEEEIEEGRRLIRKALHNAKEDPSTYQLAKAFYLKHEHYALKRLRAILNGKTT